MFGFAWVDSTDITWDVAFFRSDEEMLSCDIEHSEGNYATASTEIRNPYVGLLGPGRKIWVWLSWQDPATLVITPLFFGRLVGIPNNIFAEVVTLKFIAQPLDFQYRKQVVAETLKVAPFYDNIWLDAAHRDDPDTILEGYSALWHIDRVTHEITVSDIVTGDSIEVFSADDVFYDSVEMTIGSPPLVSVNISGTVTWEQSDEATIDIGTHIFHSYSGNNIVSEFPKPESSLGDAYSVFTSTAYDTYGIEHAITGNIHWTYNNQEETHAFGDTMSVDYSWSGPLIGLAPFSQITLTLFIQIGQIDQDPDFKDIQPATYRSTYLVIPQWQIQTGMVIRYDAKRPRTETVTFTLSAHLQQVMTNPQSPPLPSQETITLSSQSVSDRVVNILDWLSVSGLAVAEGQIIYPNNPTVPGGTSYQIAMVAGTAGTGATPVFSSIPGDLTVDGTVTWASLGPTLDSSSGNWSASTFYPVGTVIRPLKPIFAPWTSIVPLPRLQGNQVTEGQYCTSGAVLAICTLSGTTARVPPSFGAYGVVTVDGGAQWTSLGTLIPDGTIYYIVTVAGTTDPFVPPNYDPTLGAIFTNGSVTFKSLGTAGGSIEIPIGDRSRRSYFAQTRGLHSIEYLIAKARARLIMRSRVVQIKFGCRFERAMALSCRLNASITDHRIPGGTATGKIVNYKLTANGDTGVIEGEITIMCTVGYGLTVTPVEGSPTYIDAGYIESGYQVYEGVVVTLPVEDVGYTPPIDAVNDDGITFPLSANEVIVKDAIVGSVAEQQPAITAYMLLAQQEAVLATQAINNLALQQQLSLLQQTTIGTLLAPHPVYWHFELKPINRPFSVVIPLLTTTLEVPQQINVEAA